jgi:FkbM family methyltransferase
MIPSELFMTDLRQAGRERCARILSATPPFTNPHVRDKALRGYRELRRYRRLAYERLGSARYSTPALHDMETKLAPYLPSWSGVFVEAGASDGYRQSNTYYLERFCGWTGVLVEPIPESYRRCVRDRPRSRVFNCALVPEGGPSTVKMSYHGLVSTMADASSEREYPPFFRDWERGYDVTVPGRTLNAVLADAGIDRVDFLSLDVEGFELAVLAGLDLDRHKPGFVLVETNGAEAAISERLGAPYEVLLRITPNDVLYRRLATA